MSRSITIKQPNLRFSSLELNVHYSKGSRLVLFQPQLLRKLSQRRGSCQSNVFQLQLLISTPPKNCNLLFSPRNTFVLSCPFMAHKSVWCSALLQCYTCSEQCTVHQSPHALVLALLQLFHLDRGVCPSVRPV